MYRQVFGGILAFLLSQVAAIAGDIRLYDCRAVDYSLISTLDDDNSAASDVENELNSENLIIRTEDSIKIKRTIPRGRDYSVEFDIISETSTGHLYARQKPQKYYYSLATLALWKDDDARGYSAAYSANFGFLVESIVLQCEAETE